ncbi:MAG: hypothetical protein LAT52_05065 [Balneolales bacterium]|nr:hypothetical protein [Balneolales bacterium]
MLISSASFSVPFGYPSTSHPAVPSNASNSATSGYSFISPSSGSIQRLKWRYIRLLIHLPIQRFHPTPQMALHPATHSSPHPTPQLTPHQAPQLVAHPACTFTSRFA